MGKSNFMTWEVFQTPEGRKRAWRSLMVSDHGWIRKLYDNSHPISDEMWRSYQPSPDHIRRWAERGVKTIINLRGIRRDPDYVPLEDQAGFYWLEKEACAAHGITLINHRAFSREAPEVSFILDFDQMFQDMAYPAMMHCKSGADRAGISSALYMFLRQEVPLDEVLVQLSFKYGHIRQGKTGVLDYFFDVYQAAADRDGVTPHREHFLNWVQTEYDPKATTKGFKAGVVGSLLTETVLRRE